MNGKNLGEAKNIPVSEGTHHQGEEVSYTPESVRDTDGKVYVPTTTGPQSVHLTDEPQTLTVTYVEKPASTVLKYQPQAVLPNTGTQEDRATGAFGLLSLLGAFGLLFAKKKKDDEEEA